MNTSSSRPPADVTVTRRQQDILNELATGATYDDIMQRLSISRSTLREHFSKMFCEFGVVNQVQLLVRAVQRGIVTIPPDFSTDRTSSGEGGHGEARRNE
ncbi:MAG: LuxR C-terminal-related transcriptional regulator [Capsulimonadales bacterium]|nr:LuxR C-terminal-related transcriptional regulator [Capsulimonadales bacterium]